VIAARHWRDGRSDVNEALRAHSPAGVPQPPGSKSTYLPQACDADELRQISVRQAERFCVSASRRKLALEL